MFIYIPGIKVHGNGHVIHYNGHVVNLIMKCDTWFPCLDIVKSEEGVKYPSPGRDIPKSLIIVLFAPRLALGFSG